MIFNWGTKWILIQKLNLVNLVIFLCWKFTSSALNPEFLMRISHPTVRHNNPQMNHWFPNSLYNQYPISEFLVFIVLLSNYMKPDFLQFYLYYKKRISLNESSFVSFVAISSGGKKSLIVPM